LGHMTNKSEEVANTENNSATTQSINPDCTKCDNCRQQIPNAQFQIHSLGCPRKNWFCESCQRVIEKSRKDEHIQEQHSQILCSSGCGQKVERFKLAEHQKTQCNKRMVSCFHCEMSIPFLERFAHETKCGAMTEPCPDCGKRVQKKDLQVHQMLCDKSKQPSGSRRENYFCPVCQTPVDGWEELQIHMMTLHEDTM